MKWYVKKEGDKWFIYLEKKYLDYLNEEELTEIRTWDRNLSLLESLEIKLNAGEFE